MNKSNNMLKKFYPKEVELKGKLNKLAKDNSYRTDEKIEYELEHPLVVSENEEILEIGYHKDIYDEDDVEHRVDKFNTIRVFFKNKDFDYYDNKGRIRTENNPYFIDINTRMTLSEFENRLMNLENEEIEDLNE